KTGQNLHLSNLNFKIIIYALILSIIGIFMVHSATQNEAVTGMITTTQKQILGMVIGLVLMMILTCIDYHKLIKYSIVFYVISMALLIYVKYINPLNISNANRWMHLPGFGTIQPSEFSKVAVVLMAVFVLIRIQKHINNVLYLIGYFALTGITVYLIYVEPDLSTSMIIVFALVAMVFVTGISWKWVGGVLGVVAVFVGALLFCIYEPEQKTLNWFIEKDILQQYQVNRINSYFFPEDYPDQTRQQLNSVMAIGGGQLLGKGLNNSTYESVKNGNFLSEEQCDFIFAVVGEELGFAGSAFIILIYLLLFIEGLRVAGRSPDLEGKLLASGFVTILLIQCFINMGVAMLLLPNTGTPLPFISAGMSSLISTYIMMGIMLNISMHRKMKVF
ncbi:MAG: FtsW/RodA/SpoVE family cell cycle protein, partial [Lachnospiraceae bacterium]|nr:FtsW/RodA/SpoVE family cell cycle protein [Lachnospiraceae bacterium]